MTRLRPFIHSETGKVRRVYIQRSGLEAKLWFQKSKSPHATFDVRFEGDGAEFGVVPRPGEPIHLTTARAALDDLGLDMNTCTWQQIVDLAQAHVKQSRSFLGSLLGWLPFRKN